MGAEGALRQSVSVSEPIPGFFHHRYIYFSFFHSRVSRVQRCVVGIACVYDLVCDCVFTSKIAV